MALEQAAFTMDIDWLVREIQQWGIGRTDPPGLNERRLFLENGKYQIKIWNGSEWKLPNDGVLDADTLDGMQPSPDASNSTIVQRTSQGYIFSNFINTTSGASTNPTHIYGSQDSFIRKVTPTQLVAFLLSADGIGTGLDADLYRGAKLQWGTINAKDTGVFVYFAEAFNNTPAVDLTARAELTVWKTDITTTYMKVYCNSTTLRTVDWIAVG